MPFDSPDLNLGDLLKSVASGKVQLPDFQREWKWDSDRIVGLLASIAVGHPVGVIMMLEVDGDGVRFAPKPISGVDLSRVSDPDHLLLDGQQRLTSLYQSLLSGEPVNTTDSRGKKMTRWYYVDMNLALAPDGDIEEAIIGVPKDRRVRDNFGREIVADYSSLEAECKAEMFPLGKVFEPAEVFAWNGKYLALDPDRANERTAKWNDFYQRVLNNFIMYTVPVIILKKETPKEAVCTVFEKVNTGGVALNVFELLTATFAADNFRLNDDWKARKTRLEAKPVLRSLESTDFMQSISLLTTWTRRKDHFAAGGNPSEAPGVSAKRKDILKLTLPDYLTWADRVTASLEWATTFLAKEYVFVARDLPYRTQLVPLAAIHAVLGNEAETHAANEQLRQWYWCGVLGELYGGTTETRFARDVEQVIEWVRGGPVPRTVDDATFRSQRLLTLRSRNSAAYKGVYALLMRNESLDWIKPDPMHMATFFDYAVDIHHVFPKAWCERNGIDAGRRESIVNKTPLTYSTNRAIGGRPPSEYILTLENRSGLDSEALDEVIRTHLIEPAFLRTADFDAYFAERSEEMLRLIARAMGQEVIRDDGAEPDEPSAFEDEPEEVEEEPVGSDPSQGRVETDERDHDAGFDIDRVARAFHQAMLDGCIQLQQEIGYNPARFRQMVAEHGGVEAAKQLLRGPGTSDGFTRLWEAKRLNLSVEFFVVLPEYADLFTEEERSEARRRLEAHDFDVEVHLRSLGTGAPSVGG